jgi:hypothetical protein
MADAGIKKVIILKENLPGIEGGEFSYNVRYRIVQNDRNISSAWSNFYNLSAAKQEITSNLPYTYSVDPVKNNLGATINHVKVGWTSPTILKLKQYDVFIARDLVNKMDNGGTLSSGSTSYTIATEDSEIEVGQVVVGTGFASDTRITKINGKVITIDKPTTAPINNATFHDYYGTKNCYVTNINTGIQQATGTVVSGGSSGTNTFVCNITAGLTNLKTGLIVRVSSGSGKLQALTRIQSFTSGSSPTITLTKSITTSLVAGNSIQFLFFDKLETGQFTFFGRNNFNAGEIVTIKDATTTEFNGQFEVLAKDLSNTQFTLQIFKDFSLFQAENPLFDPTSSTAKVYAYSHYETTTSPISWIPRKNYETNVYFRLQQIGFPKVARKKLELFTTSAIAVNV